MTAAMVRVALSGEFRYQLVFRQVRTDRFDVTPRDDVAFHLLGSPLQALRLWGALRRALGWPGAVKSLAKLATPGRLFYSVVKSGQIVHYAWLTLSRCRHYWVDPGAVVIGPIRTAREWRRNGLATHAMRCAINAMMGRGHKVFFIDTSDENVASLGVIAKNGFGPPVGIYLRGMTDRASHGQHEVAPAPDKWIPHGQ